MSGGPLGQNLNLCVCVCECARTYVCLLFQFPVCLPLFHPLSFAWPTAGTGEHRVLTTSGCISLPHVAALSSHTC